MVAQAAAICPCAFCGKPLDSETERMGPRRRYHLGCRAAGAALRLKERRRLRGPGRIVLSEAERAERKRRALAAQLASLRDVFAPGCNPEAAGGGVPGEFSADCSVPEWVWREAERAGSGAAFVEPWSPPRNSDLWSEDDERAMMVGLAPHYEHWIDRTNTRRRRPTGGHGRRRRPFPAAFGRW